MKRFYGSIFLLKAKNPNDFICLLYFWKTCSSLIGKRLIDTSGYLEMMMTMYGKSGSMLRAPFHLADDLVWNK